MGKAQRILVVDDDPDILELLCYNLGKEGFNMKTVEDSTRAVDVALLFKPDLIILDLMMPEVSGIEVCKRLRKIPQFKHTTIFFLTARSEHYYHEAALDTGGDDFIEKIAGLRSLTNKVSTVLKKRFTIRKSNPEISVGNLKVNRRSLTANVKGVVVSLTKPELELLYFFAQNPKKIISSENLLENIWGSNIYSITTTLNVYLDNLAKKLGEQWIIELEEGKYRFMPR
jgi:two-component system alkaline phosphatase synthesis response regulator PhoP